MKNILVTGGAGFIGANFVRYWMQNHARDRVINLDALTYAGNLENLKGVDHAPNYRFVHGSICDAGLVKRLFEEENIDTVVNFAAESHVDRSITGPEAFIKTNVHGTFTLLESARKSWQNDTSACRFLHVSTDEVYGSLGPDDPDFKRPQPSHPTAPIRPPRRRPTTWCAPISTPTACRW